MDSGHTFEDYVYVNENDVDKCLICSICMSPFVHPVFCSNCKVTICWEEATKLTKCPFCRIIWETIDDLLPVSNIVSQLLYKIPVYCTQRSSCKSDTCQAPMERGDLRDHLKMFHGKNADRKDPKITSSAAYKEHMEGLNDYSETARVAEKVGPIECPWDSETTRFAANVP